MYRAKARTLNNLPTTPLILGRADYETEWYISRYSVD